MAVRIVYIGEKFYLESGSEMSAFYTERGERTDLGLMNIILRNGGEVSIRQATASELAKYEEKLRKIKAITARSNADDH